MFKFSYRPPEFSREANFYQKLPFFGDFCGHMATFLMLQPTTVKFGMSVRSWGSLSQAKFCKNCLRDIPLWGKFIPKMELPFLATFWDISAHLLSQNSKIWRGCEPAKFCFKKIG